MSLVGVWRRERSSEQVFAGFLPFRQLLGSMDCYDYIQKCHSSHPNFQHRTPGMDGGSLINVSHQHSLCKYSSYVTDVMVLTLGSRITFGGSLEVFALLPVTSAFLSDLK